jgi:hypothetical protein
MVRRFTTSGSAGLAMTEGLCHELIVREIRG